MWYTIVMSFAAKKVCLWPVKRAKCTDLVSKSRITLSFLQQLFATCNKQICCKTGLNVGGKMCNIAFQLILQQCWLFDWLLPAGHCIIYLYCRIKFSWNEKFSFLLWYTLSLEPNEELVKVIGLRHGVQVAGPNNTFSTTVWWEKPLFKHCGVKHYIYKVISDQKRRKRDINLYAGVHTVSRWECSVCFLRNTAVVLKLVCWE